MVDCCGGEGGVGGGGGEEGEEREEGEEGMGGEMHGLRFLRRRLVFGREGGFDGV